MIFTVPKTLEELQTALANRSERFIFAAGSVPERNIGHRFQTFRQER